MVSGANAITWSKRILEALDAAHASLARRPSRNHRRPLTPPPRPSFVFLPPSPYPLYRPVLRLQYHRCTYRCNYLLPIIAHPAAFTVICTQFANEVKGEHRKVEDVAGSEAIPHAVIHKSQRASLWARRGPRCARACLSVDGWH
jgi:hypothetical protein